MQLVVWTECEGLREKKENIMCSNTVIATYGHRLCWSEVFFFSLCLYVFIHTSLYVYISDMARRWCTLEGGFLSYYESERSPSAIGRVDVTEVVSLAVSKTETMTGAGYEHTPTLTYTYLLCAYVLLFVQKLLYSFKAGSEKNCDLESIFIIFTSVNNT